MEKVKNFKHDFSMKPSKHEKNYLTIKKKRRFQTNFSEAPIKRETKTWLLKWFIQPRACLGFDLMNKFT